MEVVIAEVVMGMVMMEVVMVELVMVHVVMVQVVIAEVVMGMVMMVMMEVGWRRRGAGRADFDSAVARPLLRLPNITKAASSNPNTTTTQHRFKPQHHDTAWVQTPTPRHNMGSNPQHHHDTTWVQTPNTTTQDTTWVQATAPRPNITLTLTQHLYHRCKHRLGRQGRVQTDLLFF